MKLSVAQAKQLVESERRPEVDPGWITHTIAVGDVAGEIARALQEKGFEIDPELVMVQGCMHDIGKHLGVFDFASHMVEGYKYLKALGYDEEYCYPCLTHSFLSNNPFCTISAQLDKKEDDFLIEFIRSHKFTLADHVLALCDAMCVYEPMTIEKRLVDVISRHGTGPGTQTAFQELSKLKHEFDEMLGHNLYDLFPEIKENL